MKYNNYQKGLTDKNQLIKQINKQNRQKKWN